MKRQPSNTETTDSEGKIPEAILQVFRALGLETREAREHFNLLSKPNNSEEFNMNRRESLHSQNNTDTSKKHA